MQYLTIGLGAAALTLTTTAFYGANFSSTTDSNDNDVKNEAKKQTEYKGCQEN